MPDESASQNGREQKSPPERDPWYETLREPLAVLFWIYAIIEVFIFNLDGYFISKLPPTLIWLVQFKFPILIGVIALFWIFTKNARIIFWFFYIALYPLIFIFWKVPYFFWKTKSWILVFAFINAVAAFFKSIKYNFIVLASLLISTVLIIASSNRFILWIAICILLTTLTTIFIHR